MDECKVTCTCKYSRYMHCVVQMHNPTVHTSTNVYLYSIHSNIRVMEYLDYLLKIHRASGKGSLHSSTVIFFCSIIILHFVQNDSEGNSHMLKN
jgi:hypothetical protein